MKFLLIRYPKLISFTLSFKIFNCLSPIKSLNRFALIALFVVAMMPVTAQSVTDERFIGYVVDANAQNIDMFWKDDSGRLISGFENLKKHLKTKGKELVFAMNGGMYQNDYSPVGLYIERGKQIVKINRKSGDANFYLKPNGVFYLTKDHKAHVVTTEKFVTSGNIHFATQSGPMLVIDDAIHPAFKQGSENLNIRNGVGILPDGKVLLAISKIPVNLYDFALYFQKAGCKNALYLDGFVSRIYYPGLKVFSGSESFGVMIGVYE